MAGVLLAFWVERLRARRDARILYGRILQTARSELSYLRPMCDHMRDRLKEGGSAGISDFGIPANRALLISPVVHEHAPYSLIMAITALSGYVGVPENAFQVGQSIKTKDVVQRELLNTMLADTLETASGLIMIALDQIDSELKLLGLQKIPDSATAEVSRRLREVLKVDAGTTPSRH